VIFAVGLFVVSALLVGIPSIYFLINPEIADKHDLASIIDVIHDWLPSPWDRRFIRFVAVACLLMSLGFLWMGLSIAW
jgi:hypothetical protein